MTVERCNTEIADQAHQMWAEGTADEEPLKEDIILLLSKEGFEAKDINIWMDDMMGFWRWVCDIIRR